MFCGLQSFKANSSKKRSALLDSFSAFRILCAIPKPVMLQVVAQSLRQRLPLAELMMTRVHQALMM